MAESHNAAQEGSTGPSYGATARVLHWFVFGLVAVQYGIAFTMPEIEPDAPQEDLVDWHLSLGTSILVLVVVRLIWRAMHPVPLMPGMPAWQRQLALATHHTMNTLLVVLPFLGWAGAGYAGLTVRLFGFIRLPALAEKGADWAEVAAETHAFLTFVLLGAIGLHIAGALYHQFVLRDRIMQRMLPGG